MTAPIARIRGISLTFSMGEDKPFWEFLCFSTAEMGMIDQAIIRGKNMMGKSGEAETRIKESKLLVATNGIRKSNEQIMNQSAI